MHRDKCNWATRWGEYKIAIAGDVSMNKRIDIDRYLENWQDEIESAYLYSALSKFEQQPTLADIYLHLALEWIRAISHWCRHYFANRAQRSFFRYTPGSTWVHCCCDHFWCWATDRGSDPIAQSMLLHSAAQHEGHQREEAQCAVVCSR
jgi:hypothetical protein